MVTKTPETSQCRVQASRKAKTQELEITLLTSPECSRLKKEKETKNSKDPSQGTGLRKNGRAQSLMDLSKRKAAERN